MAGPRVLTLFPLDIGLWFLTTSTSKIVNMCYLWHIFLQVGNVFMLSFYSYNNTLSCMSAFFPGNVFVFFSDNILGPSHFSCFSGFLLEFESSIFCLLLLLPEVIFMFCMRFWYFQFYWLILELPSVFWSLL